MMGHKERLKGGSEYDVLYGRRCHFGHSDTTPHKIKKNMTRRNRRHEKQNIRRLEW